MGTMKKKVVMVKVMPTDNISSEYLSTKCSVSLISSRFSTIS